jgi:hypothetical protein
MDACQGTGVRGGERDEGETVVGESVRVDYGKRGI